MCRAGGERGAAGDVGHMVEVGMEPRSGVAVSIRVRSDSAARGESGGVLSSVAPEGRVCGRRAESIAVGLFEVSLSQVKLFSWCSRLSSVTKFSPK